MSTYRKRLEIPPDSPFIEVAQMIPDSVPVDLYMLAISKAVEFDDGFCENYVHLAIASFTRSLALSQSWYIFTNDIFTRARVKRFFTDRQLLNRSLIHKNEIAVRWMTRTAYLIDNILPWITWHDSVRSLWLDSINLAPAHSGYKHDLWCGEAPVYFELMACGVPLQWSTLWRQRHLIFAHYKLTEQQYLSTWAACPDSATGLWHYKHEHVQLDAREGRRILDRALFRLLRARMVEICTALQSLRLPALVTCEILDHSWQRLAWMVPMHLKWKLATAVKHFRRRSKR